MNMYFRHNERIGYDPVEDRMVIDLDHMNMTQLLSTKQMLEDMMEKRFTSPEARISLAACVDMVEKKMSKMIED